MEIVSLFVVIMACLVCAALAVAFVGFRQTTFEQAVAAEVESRISKTTKSTNKSPRAGHRTKPKTEESRTGTGKNL